MPIRTLVDILRKSGIAQDNFKVCYQELSSQNSKQLYKIFKESLLAFCSLKVPQKDILTWIRNISPHLVDISREMHKHFQLMTLHNGHMVHILDSNYPSDLKHLELPPLALNYLGNMRLDQKPSLAIIGARKAHPETLSVTFELSKQLAKDFHIISGGAYGCDIAAHMGVLAAGVKDKYTAAIMAGGLGQLYPPRNLSTFQKILSSASGAIISERLWQMTARRYDFPIRNRIITGIAQCILVMQAGEKSGALSSAAHALEQGREVFVYYPKDSSSGFEGSLKLIEAGAQVLYT